MAVRNRAHRPDAERCHRCGHEAHEGRTQTIRRPAHAGSRLKLRDVLGRLRLKGQPSSRTGENSPYGMIGGIEETSASFEARSAPRSYPTVADLGRSVLESLWRWTREEQRLKNIQIIDRAVNATFSLFQATDEEFAAIFPGAGQDIELID